MNCETHVNINHGVPSTNAFVCFVTKRPPARAPTRAPAGERLYRLVQSPGG